MQIKNKDGKTVVPVPSLRRLPIYYQFLKEQVTRDIEYISATTIAKELNLIPIQVRKDLAYTGIIGKPKLGYNAEALIKVIENFLGWNNLKKAFLAGAGNLGQAILGYPGFKEHGLEIVAGFDIKKGLVGGEISGIKIMHLDKLENLIERMKVKIGIITAPGEVAQGIADRMVKAGIKAIWNFAPAKIIVPDDVIVQNENLASSLAVLSKRLTIKIEEKGEKNG